jgi:CheY-like chemotaxis protein
MDSQRKPITILFADDDPDDRMLVQDAFEEGQLGNELHIVEDGEEIMDYLHRRGRFAALAGAPLPGIILLDMNMPKKTGREVIREIKADPHLRHIPIVVLTTSRTEEDIKRAYDLGVSSFIVKPVAFEALVEAIKVLSHYWFGVVELPRLSRS